MKSKLKKKRNKQQFEPGDIVRLDWYKRPLCIILDVRYKNMVHKNIEYYKLLREKKRTIYKEYLIYPLFAEDFLHIEMASWFPATSIEEEEYFTK
jgi:hypothetical protein